MTLPTNYKANKNQINVAHNMYQGGAKRVLCVCSAGVLRSPTLANTLHKTYGFNVRAVGSLHNYALIPISEALIIWADEIVFVDMDSYDFLDYQIKEDIKEDGAKVIILDIPDDYEYGEIELENIILELYLRQK